MSRSYTSSPAPPEVCCGTALRTGFLSRGISISKSGRTYTANPSQFDYPTALKVVLVFIKKKKICSSRIVS
jgi:hypothetical protein